MSWSGHFSPLTAVRSALFTPATRLAAVAKASAAGADLVILDLEDGVGTNAKPAARMAVTEFADSPPHGLNWMLRVNHIGTAAGLDDLVALRSWSVAPTAIMLPKVESASEVAILASHLGEHCRFVALIETGQGLEQAAQIAAAPGVVALAFGGADLAADLGCDLAWEPMLYARGRIVQAAASAGIHAWDVPYLVLADADGLANEARAARAMGFSAKLAIHPGQIAAINSAFTPPAAEVSRAAQIIAAFDAAAGGACVLDGRMVDLPVVLAARRTLLRGVQPMKTEAKA